MIRYFIENVSGAPITDIVDRNNSNNRKIYIEAANVVTCYPNLKGVSRIIEECNGVYLMWENSLGGISDNLFSRVYKRNLKTKNIGDVERYTANRAYAKTDSQSLGYTVSETWDLINETPYESEQHRLEIESVAFSNKVFLYLSEKNSARFHFIQVKVTDSNISSIQNGNVFNDIQITIELPENNSIKL